MFLAVVAVALVTIQSFSAAVRLLRLSHRVIQTAAGQTSQSPSVCPLSGSRQSLSGSLAPAEHSLQQRDTSLSCKVFDGWSFAHPRGAFLNLIGS